MKTALIVGVIIVLGIVGVVAYQHSHSGSSANHEMMSESPSVSASPAMTDEMMHGTASPTPSAMMHESPTPTAMMHESTSPTPSGAMNY